MSIRVHLLLCPVSRLLIVCFLLGTMMCLTIGFCHNNGIENWFHLLEQSLNSLRKLLTPLMFVS